MFDQSLVRLVRHIREAVILGVIAFVFLAFIIPTLFRYPFDTVFGAFVGAAILAWVLYARISEDNRKYEEEDAGREERKQQARDRFEEELRNRYQ